MKSLSSNRQGDARRAVGARRSWLAETLLVAVILMAVANMLALRITQQEMDALATPNQHGDLWHVVNISRELQRLEYSARHHLADGGSGQGHDDLAIRLEVLQSLLAPGENAPRASTRVIAELPEVRQLLVDLDAQVHAWSQRLAAAGDAAQVPHEIVARAEGLAGQLSQASLGVHLGISQVLDQERITLYQRFALLNWMLLGLLLGMIVLVAKLIKDRRLLKRLSGHLATLNLKLERRVARRTRQLAESKALLMFILDASPSEVTLVNAETGQVHFINRRLLERLNQGSGVERLSVQELLLDGEERLRFMDELEQYGRVDNWEAQIDAPTPYWSSLTVKLVEIEGQLAHLLWGYDISRHKELLAALETQANTDTLTGLYNRRAFYERGGHSLESCKRYGHPCAILMIDIDHFKRINDSHGHAAGDEVIRTVSRILRGSLRDLDIIGRLGGEEFAVVLPQANATQALETAERLRQAIAQATADYAGIKLSVTISIGLARLSPEASNLESLLDTADKALYLAKQSGRDRVHT